MEHNEYERYGRQMIVPEWGLKGQLAVKNAKVLVVGAGGLGCPAIAYLAGAGIGTLGIVDPDVVEISNLHRQILHLAPNVAKAESAARYVKDHNPNVIIKTWCTRLDSFNALEIVREFDFVLDCTDSPASRYLINDACVIASKPLVSAAALRSEGQLAVYNSPGPCYRCLFPLPTPTELVGSCGDAGIIGPVVGIMGVYQAIEVIRLILATVNPATERPANLSMFSMFAFPQWRQVRTRGRRADCAVCGDTPKIRNLTDVDYIDFCGTLPLPPRVNERLSPEDLINTKLAVIDVRPPVQFGICSIAGSYNVPIAELRRVKTREDVERLFPVEAPYAIVCRYGNDSREAVAKLAEFDKEAHDVCGGLNAYADVTSFPRY